MAVNWTITSPSFAQTKCGVPFGSEKNVPAGYGVIPSCLAAKSVMDARDVTAWPV